MPAQPPLVIQPAPAAKPVNGSTSAKNAIKPLQETPKTVTVKLNPLTKLRVLLTEAFQKNNGESMTLSALGTALRAVDKAFDPNHYGDKSLGKVLAKMPDFVRVEIKNGVHYATLQKQTSAGAPKKPPAIAPVPIDNLAQFQVLLRKAFDQSGEEWLDLSALVNRLKQVDPNFQIKHYGSATISKLLKRMPEVVEVKQQNKKWIARLRKRG
jgi:hypothetical protein